MTNLGWYGLSLTLSFVKLAHVLVKEFKSCSLNDMVRDWVACISDSSSF